MNLTKAFAIYAVQNNLPLDWGNVEHHLTEYKRKLVAETEVMEMCDHELFIGDYVKVQCPNGSRLAGTIKELYPHIPQVKLDSGWCFHPQDEIIVHKPATAIQSNN